MRWHLPLVILPALLLSACGGTPEAPKPKALRLLVGSSMADPAKEMIDEFTRARGFPIESDFGGSETLAPKILAGAPADIFICHAPFDTQLNDKGLVWETATVASLRPAILVRPENPKKIMALADLAQPGLKIGMGNPEFSTCGERFVAALKKANLYDAVMKNVALQARANSEVAAGLTHGSLDVAVVWNFFVPMVKGKAKLSDATSELGSVDTPVVIVSLKNAPNPVARDAFINYARTENVRAIFAAKGYNAPPR